MVISNLNKIRAVKTKKIMAMAGKTVGGFFLKTHIINRNFRPSN